MWRGRKVGGVCVCVYVYVCLHLDSQLSLKLYVWVCKDLDPVYLLLCSYIIFAFGSTAWLVGFSFPN